MRLFLADKILLKLHPMHISFGIVVPLCFLVALLPQKELGYGGDFTTNHRLFYNNSIFLQ